MPSSPQNDHATTGTTRVGSNEGAIDWDALARLLRSDPSRRGIAGLRGHGIPSVVQNLDYAAREFSQRARAVAIVTGFCVIDGDQVTCETDGPPGALYLARALLEFDVDVKLVSDAYGIPLIESGCDAWGLDRAIIAEIPFDDPSPTAASRAQNSEAHDVRTDAWVERFLAEPFGKRLTHLVSIERAGPGHTVESLAVQQRTKATPVEDFSRLVASSSRNLCHNMRGESINAHTAKAHRLFEIVAARRPDVTTIAMADGGNEIGMGRVAWEVLNDALGHAEAGRIICRVPADYLLLAGISNWAAYAVVAVMCAHSGKRSLLTRWQPRQQGELIRAMVREAGAVDGLTRERTESVDGLDLVKYLAQLEAINAIVS